MLNLSRNIGVALICLASASASAEPSASMQILSPSNKAKIQLTLNAANEIWISGSRIAADALPLEIKLWTEEGKQGYLLDLSGWTPDGKYFVFSTERSDGNEPWHTPTYVLDFAKQRAYSLDEKVGGQIVSEKFQFVGKHGLNVLVGSGSQGAPGKTDREVVVDLSRLQ